MDQQQQINTLVGEGRRALAEQRFDDARGIYRQMLKVDPAQPRAWLALSAMAQRDKQFRDAVRSARAAGEAWRRNDTHAFLADICMRLLVLGEYRQARDLILEADWADPVVLRYSMGLAQYLGLTGAHEEALALAEQAIRRLGDPPAKLLLARADALRHLGRMAEATDAYEQSIALDPLCAEAHWSLAHHARSSSPGARVGRVRRALSHVRADSEAAIYLHYALFKELDDADQLAPAWAALQQGAQLKRRTLRYSSEVAAQRCHLFMQRVGARFLDGIPSPEYRIMHRPVFIVGLPRSGTTVIERMLGAHPQVRSAGELNDFTSQMSWEADRFLGEPLGESGLDAVSRIDFAALGQGYQERTAWRADGAAVLLDKLPNNVFNAGFIHKALPAAKIICVRRGAMDTCFSMFKHLFSGDAYAFSYDLSETRAHYQQFDGLIQHWARTLPDRWLQVEYENLVSEPEAWSRRLADFCDLPHDPRMARIEENRAPSATASASQIREPVHARNVDSWKRYSNWLRTALD